MEREGFVLQVEDVDNLNSVKQTYNVPSDLRSCHTAIVDGYIIEGHVPAAEIERLLAERPDIAGLAVPGMPVGSPGMEVAGIDPQPFDVLTFNEAGEVAVFASYSP